MTAELAIPVHSPSTLCEPGWWHDVALPIIDEANWDDLDRYDADLKAHIAIFEVLGREDKIELVKAKRVVEKRRGELLGEPRPGTRNDIQPLPHEVEVGIHHTTATRYRRFAAAWPILEEHLLEATDTTQVSQRALLDLAKQVLEDPDKPVKSNGQKIPRAKRAKQIARLAEKGYRAGQISDKLGVSIETIQDIAKEYEIGLPLSGHHHKIDPNQVIDQVVVGLEASVFSLSLIEGMENQFDPLQIEYWVTSLDSSFPHLRKLRNQLKEMTHDQD